MVKDKAVNELVQRSDVSDVARQLDQRLMELQALFEMSKVLNSSLNLKTILDNLLLTPMGRMMISKGMALLCFEEDKLKVETVKGIPRDLIGKQIEADCTISGPTFVEEIDEEECPSVRFFKEFGITLLLPLVSSKRDAGMVCFGPKITGGEYTASELEFLGSLSNIASTSVENGLIFWELNRVNRELDKKIQELNTLFDIGKELNSTLESDKIISLLSYAIMGELVVNRCMIFLREGEKMRLVADRGSRPTDVFIDCRGDDALLKRLCKLKESFLVEDCEDDKVRETFTDLGLIMAAPMRTQDDTKGLVAVGPKITKVPFSKHDVEFLGTLGNYAMISLENARLFEEALEKQRMEEELAIAKEIQKDLLPSRRPQLDGFDIAGLNLSSREVGGDYYDWIRIDDTHYGIAIADVSGKGAPAALLMSNVQASLRALAVAHGNVSNMVGRINNLLHATTDHSKFVTFFYGELDLAERTFTYCNAGHNPPYLLRADGSLETLEVGGLILGMMPDMPYEVEKISLGAGDSILMYTDGVSEAMGAAGKEFGEERIMSILRENNTLSAEGLIEKTSTAVKDFVKGHPQSDDLTLVTLKVL